jgi:hypothetical protein
MLLVTLLFVLTTRGVTLDFHSVARNGTRADLSPPAASPQFRRIVAASRLQEDPRSDREAYRKLKWTWDGLPPSRDSVQSAPASPASIPRRWNTPPTSILNRYYSQSDEDLPHEYNDLPTAALDPSSSEESLEATNEEVEKAADYPTPSSGEITV